MEKLKQQIRDKIIEKVILIIIGTPLSSVDQMYSYRSDLIEKIKKIKI